MQILKLSLVVTFALVSKAVWAASINDSPVDPENYFGLLDASVDYDKTVSQIVDLSRCDQIGIPYQENPGETAIDYNCAWELANKMGGTPIRDKVIIRTSNGRIRPDVGNASDPVAIITTVIPIDRLAKADKIGFSLSSQGGTIVTYVATGKNGQTREDGKVDLRDGRTGVLHLWITPFIATGSAGNCTIRDLPFKPFFSTVDASGTQTRYWDHTIGTGLGSDYNLTNSKYPLNCVPGLDSINQKSRFVR